MSCSPVIPKNEQRSIMEFFFGETAKLDHVKQRLIDTSKSTEYTLKAINQGDHEKTQLTIEGTQVALALLRYYQQNDCIDVEDLFLTYFWNHTGRQLHEQQREMLRLIRPLYPALKAQGSSGSMLIVSPTGSGKTIIIEMLYFAACMTHKFKRLPTDPQKVTVAVGCPTISLAIELHHRLVAMTIPYTYGVAPVVMHSKSEKPAKTTHGNAEDAPEYVGKMRKVILKNFLMPRFLLAKDDSGKIIPLPHAKLVAGTQGHADLMLKYRDTISPAQQGQSAKDLDLLIKFAKNTQAAGYIATFEQLLALLRKGDLHTHGDPKNPNSRTIADKIAIVIIDEAHYITNSGRPAVRAVMCWCQVYNITVILLTGTPTLELVNFANHAHIPVHTINVTRRYPRAALPFQPFDGYPNLAHGLAELAFGVWLTSLHSNRRVRGAIFIEDKLALKIVLSVLCYRVLNDTHLFYPENPLIHHHHYELLMKIIKDDLAISGDDCVYGEFIHGRYTHEFKSVFIEMAMRGILLVTADSGAAVRKQMSQIISGNNTQFSLVLATSAIAEGVNMSHIRILMVSARLRTGKYSGQCFMSSVKVEQMAGRHDREDMGGVVFIPSFTMCNHVQETIPNSCFFAELVGQNMSIAQLDLLRGCTTDQFDFEESTFFDHEDITYMFRGSKLYEHYQSVVYKISGYGPMPYWTMDKIKTVFGFYITDDGKTLKTSLLMRITRMFRKNNQFALCVFAYNQVIIQQLVRLPCVVILGIVVLFLSLKSYSPDNDPILQKRTQMYIAFAKKRYSEVLLRPGCAPLVNAIQMVIKQMVASHSSWRIPSDTSWVMKKPRCPDHVVNAFTAFLTEIVLAHASWEVICAEYSIHHDVFGGFMGILDAFIEILLDDPAFPLADAQGGFIFEAAKLKNDQRLIDGAQQCRGQIGSAVARLVTCVNLDSTYFCGYHDKQYVVEGPLDGYTPMKDTMPDECIAENRMLTLIVVVASILKDVLGFTTEVPFSEHRHSYHNPSLYTLPPQTKTLAITVSGMEKEMYARRPLTADLHGRIASFVVTSQDMRLAKQTRQAIVSTHF
jgi:hypothetical protein